MDLIFEETKNRRRCGSETVVDGIPLQCGFSTSKMVTIPAGLRYFGGRLSFSEETRASTIPICRNHEMQINMALRALSASGNS
jgi:hypothetical protein